MNDAVRAKDAVWAFSIYEAVKAYDAVAVVSRYEAVVEYDAVAVGSRYEAVAENDELSILPLTNDAVRANDEVLAIPSKFPENPLLAVRDVIVAETGSPKPDCTSPLLTCSILW